MMSPLNVASIKKRPNLMSSRRNYPLHQPTDSSGDRISFQRHTTSPSSSSNFEFGMYSLLTIVSVASIIVVLLYSVFSLRFRHKSAHVTTTATQSRRLHNLPPFLPCVFNHGDNQASVTNAKEWVWMGKDKFENGANRWNSSKEEADFEEMQVQRPLLPVCDYNGNITNMNTPQMLSSSIRGTVNSMQFNYC